MKNNYFLTRILLCSAILFAVLLAGCSNDRYDDMMVDGDDMVVRMSISVPGMVVPSSRAMTGDEEKYVEDICVIAFHAKNNGEEVFMYHTYAIPEGGNYYKVKLQRSENSERQRFVFIANMGVDEMENILRGLDPADNIQKQDLLNMIKFDAFNVSASESNRPWDTNSPRSIPMWGESKMTYIVDKSMQGTTINVQMLRALASVDVKFGSAMNTGGKNYFKLQDVVVYNSNSKAYAAPNKDNIEIADPGTNKERVRATDPSIVQESERDHIFYSVNNGHGTPAGGMVREIYIPEAQNRVGDLNVDDGTFIVISGYYGQNNNTELTWYRLDFLDGGNTEKNLNVLRNFRYNFVITSVSGPGYGDRDQAANSLPMNLNTEIIAWDEGDMNDIDFNGQYHLALSKSTFEFYRHAGAEDVMKVYTDYPEGWKVDRSTLPSWLDVTPDRDDSGTSVQVTVKTTGANYGSAPRNGDFYLVAGTLRKKISVVQKHVSEMRLDVTPNVLTFTSDAPESKTFTVDAYPADLPLYISVEGDMQSSDWVINPVLESGTSTKRTFEVQPKPNANINSRSAVFTILMSMEGNAITAKVTVNQMAGNPDIIVEKDDYYPAAGGYNTFKVWSHTPWWVSSTQDTKGMLLSWDDQEQPAKPVEGATFTFNLKPNNTFYEREATFVLAGNSPFPGGSISIKQGIALPELNMISIGATAFEGGAYSSAASELKFSANTTWNIKSDTYYSKVISNIKESLTLINPGSTNGTVNPLSSRIHTLAITPTSYGAVSTTPASGTRYSTTIAVQAVEYGEEATKPNPINVTLTRTVPSHFSSVSASNNTSSINKSGETVIISANTNAAWTATPNYGSTKTGSASAYGKKTLDVFIPANNTGVSRTVKIEVKQGSTLHKTFTYTQEPDYSYTVTSNLTENSTISPQGASYKFTITGTKVDPNLKFRAVIKGTSNLVCEKVIPYNNVNTVNITIFHNTSLVDSRNISLEYLDGDKWVVVNSGRQPNQSCGTSTSARQVKIGDNLYYTQGYNGKCWMVNNSLEGTPAATGTGVYGGYYPITTVGTACPDQWQVPTYAHYTELLNYLKANSNKTYWTSNTNLAGHYDGNGRVYKDQGNIGAWWAGGTQTIDVFGYKRSTSEYYSVKNMAPTTPNWYSVRCISKENIN